MIYTYTVGQLYNPKRRHWPEASQLYWRDGAHELVLFLASPSPEEVQDIRDGRLELALLPYRSALFLLYQFGRMPWSDVPYNIHLVERVMGPQVLPSRLDSPDDETYRAWLHVVLVDAVTGIVQALRAVSMSPAFTRRLHQEIRAQREVEWPGHFQHDLAIQTMYEHFPTSQGMLVEAVARCVGGEE